VGTGEPKESLSSRQGEYYYHSSVDDTTETNMTCRQPRASEVMT